MDLDLQDRIANMDKYDFDVNNNLKLLLENRPNSLRQDLEDWRLEKHSGKNILFYKDKNYIPDNLDLWQDIIKCSMITKRQDTWENWKCTIQSNNITGGQGCELSSSDMCKDVAFANSSRSIGTCHTRHTY